MLKNAMEKVQTKSVTLWEKVKNSIRNEKGEIGQAGKILIACLVIVAVLAVTKVALTRMSDTTTKTLDKIDQEVDSWN